MLWESEAVVDNLTISSLTKDVLHISLRLALDTIETHL